MATVANVTSPVPDNTIQKEVARTHALATLLLRACPFRHSLEQVGCQALCKQTSISSIETWRRGWCSSTTTINNICYTVHYGMIDSHSHSLMFSSHRKLGVPAEKVCLAAQLISFVVLPTPVRGMSFYSSSSIMFYQPERLQRYAMPSYLRYTGTP